MNNYKNNNHYIDFSTYKDLTAAEKYELEQIQKKYYPIERTDYLTEYYLNGKINDDEYEKLTTVQFQYIED